MAATRRVKFEVELPDDAIESMNKRGAEPRKPTRGRWTFRFVVLLLLLAGLAVASPTILSATGLWKSLLAAAVPDLAGKIEIGSLSLAWWSPIEMQNLTVHDEQGDVIAQVPLVRSHKTLLALAMNYRDLGTFEVTQPRAKIVLRQDGSNIEDFLAKLPQSDSDGASPAAAGFSLVLTRGTVELDDTIAGRQWAIENLSVDFAWPAAADQPKTGKLTATVGSLLTPSETSGEMAAEFSWQPGTGEGAVLGAGQADIQLGGLPTELLEGALRRFDMDIRPQGALTLDAGYVWTDDGNSQHLVVRQLAAPQLAVASPALLGSDRLTVNIATGQADVLIAGDKLDIRQLRLESNLLQLSGKGMASLTAPTDASDVEVTGQIDLAELARQLPGTLHMRPDTQLNSGIVQVSLASRAEQAGRRWQASLKTDRLRATAGGRPVEFDEPLAIDFAVRIAPEGPAEQAIVVEQLVGRASFLKLNGNGTLGEGTLTAEADLDKLVAELGQLVDWGNTKLAGTLAAQVRWNRGESNLWTARADARVQNFEMLAAGIAPWRESNLQIGADVTGLLGTAGLTEIHAARLTVASAGDRLEATLAEPVKEVSSATAWPIAISLQGELATWMPRVQPVVSLAGWEFAGAIDVRGAGRFSPAASQLGKTHLEIENLEIAGPGLWIREPQLKLDTSGSWDQAKLTLALPETVLQSTAIGLRADDLRLVAGEQPTITGLVDFRGNPARLSDWLGDKGSPRTWQVAGDLTGRVEIAAGASAQEATITADIGQFQFLTPEPAPAASPATMATAAMKPRWAEEKVSLTGQAGYEPATGKVTLARSNLQLAWLNVATTGTISDLTTSCLTDLAGEISYDLAVVEQKIKTELYPRTPQDDPSKQRSIDTLVLRGQEKRPFVLRGPLFATVRSPQTLTAMPLVPEELVGEASLGWESAQYVGLVAGAADFKAQLKQGTVFIGPLDIPVSDGRLTTAPRILLNAPVPSVVFERGPLIQNVQITAEMCNQWLKYVAPLVADSTEAQGKFSLALEGASVPIFTPMASIVHGTLAIHGAQVGPGPLAKKYLAKARQLKAIIDPTAAQGDNYGRWLALPEHNVAFAVQDGIVSHDGLTMTAQNFVMTTKGLVRIEDQAIDLDANIPIQDSWFKKDQQNLLGSLRGQAVPIKITGTLSGPRLDTKAYEGLAKQLAGSAVQGFVEKNQQKVQGLIDKEAGKLLNGLFGPQPKPARPTPAPTP
ncbi:MAG: hypothetical protein WD872_06420 [Pirellulaceae bacterium]